MARSTTAKAAGGEAAVDTAPQKPSCLGLLNAISVAEGRAGVVLSAWAAATPDKKLRKTLELVAARETDHHHLFRARIEEMGFSLREGTDSEGFQKAVEFFASDASDRKKVKRSRGRDNGDGGDVLAPLEQRVRDDESIDTVTRHLLQWYLDEERDSGKRLGKAYGRVLKK